MKMKEKSKAAAKKQRGGDEPEQVCCEMGVCCDPCGCCVDDCCC